MPSLCSNNVNLDDLENLQVCNTYQRKIKTVPFFYRGPQTMIEYYKISKQYCEECMQLTPAFDISLFEEDHDNMLDNDPFIMSQQGFQTLVRNFYTNQNITEGY